MMTAKNYNAIENIDKRLKAEDKYFNILKFYWNLSRKEDKKMVDKFIEKIQKTIVVAIDASTETSSASEELSSTSYELSSTIAEQMERVSNTENLISDIGKNLDVTEERAISTTEDLEEQERHKGC